MPDLSDASKISAAGLKAQSIRLRVLSENLANAQSTGKTPGESPYRRKLVIFDNELDRALGFQKVEVRKIRQDQSDFIEKFDPAHPAADSRGIVKFPNVNPLIELMDMREAQRSYEANLSAMETSKRMANRTLDMLQKR
jgi:flagellar basal-body rod protein FlgC